MPTTGLEHLFGGYAPRQSENVGFLNVSRPANFSRWVQLLCACRQPSTSANYCFTRCYHVCESRSRGIAETLVFNVPALVNKRQLRSKRAHCRRSFLLRTVNVITQRSLRWLFMYATVRTCTCSYAFLSFIQVTAAYWECGVWKVIYATNCLSVFWLHNDPCKSPGLGSELHHARFNSWPKNEMSFMTIAISPAFSRFVESFSWPETPVLVCAQCLSMGLAHAHSLWHYSMHCFVTAFTIICRTLFFVKFLGGVAYRSRFLRRYFKKTLQRVLGSLITGKRSVRRLLYDVTSIQRWDSRYVATVL